MGDLPDITTGAGWSAEVRRRRAERTGRLDVEEAPMMSAAEAHAASVRMFAVEQAAKTVAAIVSAPDAAPLTWSEVGEQICSLATTLERHIAPPTTPGARRDG